jgi:uncharacterized membrane protein
LHHKQLIEGIASITILLGLPMLMYSLDLTSWFKTAGKSILCLFLGFIAITIITILGFYLFRGHMKEPAKISGMLIALYTGGTPNLATMKTALNVDDSTFVIINTYDIAVGMVYFTFIITLAQAFFNLFMKPYKSIVTNIRNEVQELENDMEFKNEIWVRKYFKPILVSFGLSVGIALISVYFGQFFAPDIQMQAIILIITSLAIIASLNVKVRKLKKTFSSGMFLVLIFCFAMGSLADLRSFTLESIYILYDIALIIFGTLALHAILSWIFGIDTDTFIMVSIGLIFSPPYVPAVAAALHNKNVMLAGIVSGLLSYAAGNYMGVAIAYMLK